MFVVQELAGDVHSATHLQDLRVSKGLFVRQIAAKALDNWGMRLGRVHIKTQRHGYFDQLALE